MDLAHVVELLRITPERELPERLQELGAAEVLDLVLQDLTSRFRSQPGRLPGLLSLELSDRGQTYVRSLLIGEDGARPAEPLPGEEPRATLRTSLVRFLRVSVGAQDPRRLLLMRRMKVTGDLTWTVATLGSLTP
ncbi:MAG: hypothetical protein JWL64_176 [Frankiales bacterium]|nr:hypothetical protein [Frankiales bacterium]